MLTTYFLPARILRRDVLPAPDGPKMKVSRPGRNAPQASSRMICSPLRESDPFLVHKLPLKYKRKLITKYLKETRLSFEKFKTFSLFV